MVWDSMGCETCATWNAGVVISLLL